MFLTEAVEVILIIAVAYVILRIIDLKANQWSTQESQRSHQQLEDHLWSLLVAEMEKRLKPITGDLDDVQRRIDNIVDELETWRDRATNANSNTVLLICGDEEFCKSDRHALRRANVDFYRLANATQVEVEREFQRGRENHEPFRRVHIAAHASPEGIRLADGLADGGWWNEHLDGVNLLVLAVCQGVAIADQLAGLVDVVISVREDIENTLASEFTYVFWNYIQEDYDPRDAYRQTRKDLPAIAEYISIRADMRRHQQHKTRGA